PCPDTNLILDTPGLLQRLCLAKAGRRSMAYFLLALPVDFRLYFVLIDGERHPGKARYEPSASSRGTRREILKGLHQKSIRQGDTPAPASQNGLVWDPESPVGLCLHEISNWWLAICVFGSRIYGP